MITFGTGEKLELSAISWDTLTPVSVINTWLCVQYMYMYTSGFGLHVIDCVQYTHSTGIYTVCTNLSLCTVLFLLTCGCNFILDGAFYTESKFGTGDQVPYIYTDMNCSGLETGIVSCPLSDQIEGEKCLYGRAVGVKCYSKTYVHTAVHVTNCHTLQTILVVLMVW